MKYQNQKLKDFEIKVIGERIQVLRDRVDDLQVWIDFKDIKNRFALRGLDPFFNRLVEQKHFSRRFGRCFPQRGLSRMDKQPLQRRPKTGQGSDEKIMNN